MKLTFKVNDERYNITQDYPRGPGAWCGVHDDYDLDDKRCFYGERLGAVVEEIVEFELEKADA